MVTSRASLGSDEREFSSIIRVSSDWSSDPQFTPMRTGFWFSTATSTMVRKFESSLRPMPTLPGLIRYFASALRATGILLQKDMAVVMEVADDRDVDSALVELLHDVRHRSRSIFIVYGNSDQF